MEMDEADPRPAYQRVADDLRKAIVAGTYQPGDQLPTLAELTSRYGIAVMTARDAIRQLSNEGTVVSRQGKGAYVVKRPEAPAIPPASELIDLFQHLSDAVADLNDRMTAVEERLSGQQRPTGAPPPEDAH
jgi:GntR family transcriptional regulator